MLLFLQFNNRIGFLKREAYSYLKTFHNYSDILVYFDNNVLTIMCFLEAEKVQ